MWWRGSSGRRKSDATPARTSNFCHFNLLKNIVDYRFMSHEGQLQQTSSLHCFFCVNLQLFLFLYICSCLNLGRIFILMSKLKVTLTFWNLITHLKSSTFLFSASTTSESKVEKDGTSGIQIHFFHGRRRGDCGLWRLFLRADCHIKRFQVSWVLRLHH